MKTLLWFLGLGFGVFGAYMIVMNGLVFANNHILKRKWTSAVPLVGGVAGMIGLICLPVEGLWKYCWVPLLIDWGSFPVMVVALTTRKRKGHGLSK